MSLCVLGNHRNSVYSRAHARAIHRHHHQHQQRVVWCTIVATRQLPFYLSRLLLLLALILSGPQQKYKQNYFGCIVFYSSVSQTLFFIHIVLAHLYRIYIYRFVHSFVRLFCALLHCAPQKWCFLSLITCALSVRRQSYMVHKFVSQFFSLCSPTEIKSVTLFSVYAYLFYLLVGQIKNWKVVYSLWLLNIFIKCVFVYFRCLFPVFHTWIFASEYFARYICSFLTCLGC